MQDASHFSIACTTEATAYAAPRVLERLGHPRKPIDKVACAKSRWLHNFPRSMSSLACGTGRPVYQDSDPAPLALTSPVPILAYNRDYVFFICDELLVSLVEGNAETDILMRKTIDLQGPKLRVCSLLLLGELQASVN